MCIFEMYKLQFFMAKALLLHPHENLKLGRSLSPPVKAAAGNREKRGEMQDHWNKEPITFP